MTQQVSETCLNCAGRCCVTYIVPVTGYDIWRISRAQQLAPLVFVQREPEPPSSATGFLLRPGGPTYGTALRHQPVRHNQRPCLFLMHLKDGYRRCGIYADRPRACQTYPLELREQRVALRNDPICGAGSWHGATEQAAWRQLLQHQAWEWEVYGVVVRAWNEGIAALAPEDGRIFEQYLDYLLHAYDALAEAGIAPGAQPESFAERLRAVASAVLRSQAAS
jgi:Fe-S-cluster containining protein